MTLNWSGWGDGIERGVGIESGVLRCGNVVGCRWQPKSESNEASRELFPT